MEFLKLTGSSGVYFSNESPSEFCLVYFIWSIYCQT